MKKIVIIFLCLIFLVQLVCACSNVSEEKDPPTTNEETVSDQEDPTSEEPPVDEKEKATDCIVTFVYENGQNNLVVTVKLGDKVAMPDKPSKVENKNGQVTIYSFEGWQEDGATEYFNFETEISKDLTLIAKWKKESTHVRV